MLHPTLMAGLARERQADLHRAAARRARVRELELPSAWSRARCRTGLVLIGLGTRLMGARPGSQRPVAPTACS